MSLLESIVPSPLRLKKRLLIVGYFGASNLGDELMLETLLAHLKDTRQSYEITIMLTNETADITRYGNYHFISSPKTSSQLNKIAENFDAIICPGGALIDHLNFGLTQTPPSVGTLITVLSLRFTTMGKPAILFGLSSNGELHGQDFINKLNRLVNDAQHFSVRDDNSLRALQKAGVRVDSIQIVDDIILANAELATLSTSKGRDIGLIYIYNEETMPQLKVFTKALLDILPANAQLKLIPFYDYMNSDVIYAKKLIKTVGSARLSLYSEVVGDFSETAAILSSMSTVFSMRYHGTLLANMLGKRVICINYDTHPHYPNKNQYIYSHYGFSKYMIDFSRIDKVTLDGLQGLIKSSVRRPDVQDIHKSASSKLERVIKEIL